MQLDLRGLVKRECRTCCASSSRTVAASKRRVDETSWKRDFERVQFQLMPDEINFRLNPFIRTRIIRRKSYTKLDKRSFVL